MVAEGMRTIDPKEPIGFRTNQRLLPKVQQPIPTAHRLGVPALEYSAAGENAQRPRGRPRRALAGDHHGALRRLGGDDPGLAESAGMFLGSAARLALLSGEELMKELNGDGAFTDR